MFVAIVGTRYSGKTTVEDYLIHLKGFTSVRLIDDESLVGKGFTASNSLSYNGHASERDLAVHPSGNSPPDTSALGRFATAGNQALVLSFRTPTELLDHVTRNWRSDFVTTDITCSDVLEKFSTRPFFLLLSIDAPLMDRYRRCSQSSGRPLEEFLQEHDHIVYGNHASSQSDRTSRRSSLNELRHLVDMHVVNAFDTLQAFHSHLDELNILDRNRLRPHWDTYFMTLASLAAQRSNCMKRRVGAVLVRDNRIVATGYNGTPRGVTNCNEGGCPRCNSGLEALDECLCLHAEENALLEAGRERVGVGAVLYCNTCPCLKCTIKIIQTGVTEVIYNLSYKVDDASAKLFGEAGVQLRRHAPPP